MKRQAVTLLTLGAGLLTLGLLLTISALDRAGTVPRSGQVVHTCLNCHADVHADDLATPTVRLIQSNQPEHPAESPLTRSASQDGLCSDCHATGFDTTMLADEYEARIAATRLRVATVREDLAGLQQAHPDWHTDAAANTDMQLIAEQITTLLDYVEADGSWGFHHPEYTDARLAEAESLLAELIIMLE